MHAYGLVELQLLQPVEQALKFKLNKNLPMQLPPLKKYPELQFKQEVFEVELQL